MAGTDGQQFVEATNNRLQSIEAAIANHVMPDDGRTDRQIQIVSIVDGERSHEPEQSSQC